MGVTKSTNTNISQRTETYAAEDMLTVASPVIVLDKFGMNRPMPKNKGVKIEFRRPIVFEADTTPLQEGVTPTSTEFGYENVSTNLKHYGFLITVTDVIEDTHEDPVIKDAAEQAGLNIARTQEALMWGVLRGGTNVFYANGSVRSAVNSVVTKNKLRAVTRSLKANKAMKITKILDPSPDYETRAVEAAYIGVAHTDLESDIRNLDGFVKVAEYGRRQVVHDHEIGTVEDIRFVLSPDLSPYADAGGSTSTMISTTGTNADVYPIIIFGREAYATVPLRGPNALEPTIIPPGRKEKSDPLGQRGYIGYKFWWAGLILNQVWLARLEVAATDL